MERESSNIFRAKLALPVDDKPLHIAFEDDTNERMDSESVKIMLQRHKLAYIQFDDNAAV
jgi:hypothetical protein